MLLARATHLAVRRTFSLRQAYCGMRMSSASIACKAPAYLLAPTLDLMRHLRYARGLVACSCGRLVGATSLVPLRRASAPFAAEDSAAGMPRRSA